MNTFEINLISVVVAFVLFLGYVFYLIIRSRHRLAEVKAKWQEKVQTDSKFNAMTSSSAAAAEVTEVSQLLKSKSASDTYFNSKLPKVEGLKEWILHAGIELNPFVFSVVWVFAGVAVGLVFFFSVHSSAILSALIAVLSTFLLPYIFIAYLTHRRKNQFLQEFPHALDMIRRALKSGHSVDRALEMVVEHIGGPVGDTFKRVTEKMRLGETPENVLAEVANRVGVDDFRMLAIVIVLQRETGGSLAEAIENFSKIIRARQNLRKKIAALSAEGRVSAIVLISIPFVVMGAIFFTTPTYLDPLFKTGTGQNLLIVAGLMMSAGIGTILRMVYREIY